MVKRYLLEAEITNHFSEIWKVPLWNKTTEKNSDDS